MPTKEQMLERIDKHIARKDKTFGCRLKLIKKYEQRLFSLDVWDIVLYAGFENKYWTVVQIDKIADNPQITIKYEVIWHPVMIGDVLRYWLSHNLYNEKTNENWWNKNALIIGLIARREKLDKPIDDQSDECIKFVYYRLPTK